MLCLLLCRSRIEPDGQRPKVLLHGKSCRKTANPKCSYDSSDTRAGIEVGCVGGSLRVCHILSNIA